MKSALSRVAWRASAVSAFVLAWLEATPAWACPSCTTRGSGGTMIPIILGAMILTPYVVTTVVLRVIRKAEAERAREEQVASASSPSAALPTAH